MQKNTSLNLPCKKVTNTYLMLKDLNFTSTQARSLTKRCYDSNIEKDIKRLVKSLIKKAHKNGLKDEEAINYLKKEFQEFNEIKQAYSNNNLVQPYGVPFLNYLF